MELPIEKITIVEQYCGPDAVFIFTGLPTSMPKCVDQNLIMKFDVAKGSGSEYVEQHFPGNTVTIVRDTH
jgi:hypothetical protein